MEETSPRRTHVLVVPFLGQGHLNPMLCFSQCLATKGIKITLAASVSAIQSLPPLPQDSSITVEPIYDDITEGGYTGPGGFKGFVERLQTTGSRNITEIVKKHQNSDNAIKCLVYDINVPWCLQLAKGLGLLGAAFVTQSCATMSTYLNIMQEIASGSPDPLASVPEFGFDKLPSMGSDSSPIPGILLYILNHFRGIENADWILLNSFDKLEEEVVKDLMKKYPVKTIGPTVTSMYPDNRVEVSKSTEDGCIDWLNTKETGSVLYVAFGSAVILSPEQMEELAWGLKQSHAHFLWVVRASEENKLPHAFKEEMAEKGLVVTWGPQLEVLSHKAVGCFMTHCGWNSTVEAVSLGVPMIALPQYLDQFGDAMFVETIWEVGVRPKTNHDGLVTREEIVASIKEMMEGERGQKIRRNAIKWKDFAREAVEEGGTSDKNIEDIVAGLVSH